MHYESDFSAPPGRRLGSLALFRNGAGQVLLVEKRYRSGPQRWGLPGGCAKEEEPAAIACQRDVEEELGLRIVPDRVLLIHHMPAEGNSREGLNTVFDGGYVADGTQLVLNDELISCRWVSRDELPGLVAPYTRWRVDVALDVLTGAWAGPGVPYLIGHGPGAELAAA